MKRTLLLILVGAVIGGGLVWMTKRGDASKPAGEAAAGEKPADEEGGGTSVTHDENGRAVINMSDETQGDIGILVTNPAAARIKPELKAYGRVLDPAPLAALVTELATARAVYAASSNELARLQTLSGLGNTSARALQTAEASAVRDQLAVQSARDRMALSFGRAVAEQNDLPAFMQSLTSQEAALIRVDLPVGEALESPAGARIVTASGKAAEAEFLGAASGVDPQMQGRGFFFLMKSNSLRLLSDQAVTAYLKVPGEPFAGVIVPREAVVRAEGAGWVYVLNPGGESFTRVEVPLDHSTDAGWFVTNGITAGDHAVTTGAQQLLSEELKGKGGGE